MLEFSDIKLGYACNNECIHCIIQDQKKNTMIKRKIENRMTDECFHEIDDSFDRGSRALVITGGEPTIRNDFIKIVLYAKRKGMYVAVQTNARKFSNEQFCEQVVPYIDSVIFALHGSHKKIHDSVTRKEDSFEETIQGIKNLIHYKADISLTGKIVISKKNYLDLSNILLLFNSLGVKNVNIAFPHACESMLKEYDKIVPYYSELEEQIRQCVEISQEENMVIDFETILPCALREKYDIKYFADYKNYLVGSEVRQLDSDTLNWNTVRKQLKQKINVCKDCIYNDFCEGYWLEYIMLRGESEFLPIQRGKNENIKKNNKDIG